MTGYGALFQSLLLVTMLTAIRASDAASSNINQWHQRYRRIYSSREFLNDEVINDQNRHTEVSTHTANFAQRFKNRIASLATPAKILSAHQKPYEEEHHFNSPKIKKNANPLFSDNELLSRGLQRRIRRNTQKNVEVHTNYVQTYDQTNVETTEYLIDNTVNVALSKTENMPVPMNEIPHKVKKRPLNGTVRPVRRRPGISKRIQKTMLTSSLDITPSTTVMTTAIPRLIDNKAQSYPYQQTLTLHRPFTIPKLRDSEARTYPGMLTTTTIPRLRDSEARTYPGQLTTTTIPRVRDNEARTYPTSTTTTTTTTTTIPRVRDNEARTYPTSTTTTTIPRVRDNEARTYPTSTTTTTTLPTTIIIIPTTTIPRMRDNEARTLNRQTATSPASYISSPTTANTLDLKFSPPVDPRIGKTYATEGIYDTDSSYETDTVTVLPNVPRRLNESNILAPWVLDLIEKYGSNGDNSPPIPARKFATDELEEFNHGDSMIPKLLPEENAVLEKKPISNAEREKKHAEKIPTFKDGLERQQDPLKAMSTSDAKSVPVAVQEPAAVDPIISPMLTTPTQLDTSINCYGYGISSANCAIASTVTPIISSSVPSETVQLRLVTLPATRVQQRPPINEIKNAPYTHRLPDWFKDAFLRGSYTHK